MRITRQLFIGSIMLLGFILRASGQCTELGQTPGTAFPVCGSAVFTQKEVPVCTNHGVPTACSQGLNDYEDVNPYWYKFTCFAAGTLQLTITPKDPGDDYDWQIFDVTGHSPSDVYSDKSLMVAYNWSGRTGTTGTVANAASLFECGSFNSFNPPINSKMPNLILGHNYLLMISHFSGDSQSGYDLSFVGGTASITDSVPPAIKSLQPVCDGTRMLIVLNKKMKCSSLAADGSDFTLEGTTVRPVSAKGNSCSAGFDMDSIVLQMNGPIVPGDYFIRTQPGSDGNVLLDNCATELPRNIRLPFHLAIPQPIAPDSLTKPGCSPSVLQLVFPKRVYCNTIAPDGSDFEITGSFPVTISGAGAVCDEYGQSYKVEVRLSAPILRAGNFILHLKRGVDGNTMIDECGLEILEGPGLPFETRDTVDASAMTGKILYGCVEDTIVYDYPNQDQVNKWAWIFAPGDTVHSQHFFRTFTVFDGKTVQLIAGNDLCSDTASMTVMLDNAINAAFEAPQILCPRDAAVYKNNSTGNLNSWVWDLGDGTTDQSEDPSSHLYAETGIETKYRIRLIVGNYLGCKDTAYQDIDVLRSCYIAVPSAFTPNGDGLNDYLYPLNAFKAVNLEFRVYNRYGQMVFFGRDWLSKWDGRINGNPQPPGTYVWMLQYTDGDTKKKIFMKGTSVLIR